MKIHAQKLGFAAAVVATVLYIVCWALVAAMPAAAMGVTESMLHMRLEGVSWNMSASSLLGGAGAWAIVSGGGVWATAALYNRFSGGAN